MKNYTLFFHHSSVIASLFITLMIVSALYALPHQDNAPGTLPAGAESDWWSGVQNQIARSEYDIKWQETRQVYQSPNRAHNLRFTYFPDGFMVESRVIEQSPSWQATLILREFGRENAYRNFKSQELHVAGNMAKTTGDCVTIEYQNDENGMRQNFVIHERVAGTGDLYLHFNVQLHNVAMNDYKRNTLSFGRDIPGGAVVLYYGDMKVWDARGDELTASLYQLSDNEFAIALDDRQALYPITIDPLSTSPDWTAEGNQDNTQYGYCIAAAGDVNGDTYGDLMVSAPYYDDGASDQGRVFVYHGSSIGLSTTPDWVSTGENAFDQFGNGISSAGDVNGDGYSDIAVGAQGYATNTGRTYVYHGSSSGLSSTPAWMAIGEAAGNKFGVSIHSAGDVNGDGYSDVAVGAPAYLSNTGRAYVYQGSSSGLSTTPAWTVTGENNDDLFSTYTGLAGDIDGDGYSDVIISAPGYPSGNSQGKAYAYHGSSSGLSVTPTWTDSGENNGDQFGTGACAAGDVNGDGYSDVAVGAPGYATSTGRTYVYHGSSTGLSTTSAWTATGENTDTQFGFSVSTAGDANGDGFADIIIGAPAFANQGKGYVYYGSLAGLSVAAEWTATGENSGDQYGFSVATAGDINGNGVSDIVIGAPTFDGGHADEGKAYVYYGTPGGLSVTQNWEQEGNQGWAYYGRSVSSAGDVNGDGYSDVIIGATHYDNGQNEEGMTFLFNGSASGLATSPSWTAEGNQVNAFFGSAVSSAGDVNGDGYCDVIVGAYYINGGQVGEGRVYVYHGSATGLSPTADWTFESNSTRAYLGMSVGTAGDVNGDGYSDVIAGAPNYGDASYFGRAYVFHGSQTGLSTTPDWNISGGMRDAFGSGVGTAGDVNGDGYSDIIVGSDHWDNDQAWEGAAFAYYGSASGLSTTPDWSAEGNQINAYYGNSVSTAGDVNGDGYSDVIVGDSKYDVSVTDEGRAYVYHGSSSGLSSSAAWIGEGTSMQAYFGQSVSTAGDVNGDGYSDIIVGGIYQDTVRVYHGSNTGLSSTPDWFAVTGDISFQFGYSVSDAGDVNGDGYGDVIATAPNYDNELYDEGIALVYYGNNGTGTRVTPRQWRADFSAPVVPALFTHSTNQAGLGMYGRTFYGRSPVKVEFEVKQLGVPFDGLGLQESAWTDCDITGVQINKVVNSFTTNTLYKWRARIMYPLVNSVQAHGPWFFVADNGMTESDFRVGPPVGIQETVTPLVANNLITLPGRPNPFPTSIALQYCIGENTAFELSIYDITGQRIRKLYEGNQKAGNHTLLWDGRDESGNTIPAGIYFVRYTTPTNCQTQKVVKLK